MNNDFIELKKEIFNILNNNKHIVLATSLGDNITARTIEKVLQIKNNSNVALCLDNLQIIGIAQILNHPSENNEFLQKYKQIHYNAYNKYSMLEKEVVIKVKINKASLWKYENDSGHKLVIDLINKEFWNE